MREAAVIIPNLNGRKWLDGCLSSLRRQSFTNFETILVDNGSTDGSAEFVREHFPEVKVVRFSKNTGFCHAVNTGIKRSESPYVILLNNDVVCGKHFVEELVKAIRRRHCFSCQAKMVSLQNPEILDDTGDYYCALGWAFTEGKGRKDDGSRKEKPIFSSCAGAAIYDREILIKIGLFDDRQFAYLEDVDVGYRARIAGYENWYVPGAVVRHAGSSTSGSVYNAFKVRHASRNSIYIIYKNMPLPQIVINLPFLAVGFAVKFLFFAHEGYFKEYTQGIRDGFRMCRKSNKFPFRAENWKNYLNIQLELWANLWRRVRILKYTGYAPGKKANSFSDTGVK